MLAIRCYYVIKIPRRIIKDMLAIRYMLVKRNLPKWTHLGRVD